MDNAKVTAVRSIELGVTNLDRAAAFYRGVWGLEPVAVENDSIHLRANGPEHHVVTLRERPKAAMLGVHFAAQDRNAVDALHARAKAFGASVAGGGICCAADSSLRRALASASGSCDRYAPDSSA